MTGERGTWYGAKAVFRHADLEEHGQRLFEERVVLIRATSPHEAIRKAEEQARKYAAENGVTWVEEYICTYEMFDEELGEGTEVWSLMRRSALDEAQYLRRFYSTGSECAQDGNAM